MSMVIGTNVASLTAQRHLESSRADLNQSMERLSSGQRINSAADDAAGLGISDKMSSQINGLTQAVRNSNDAISLAQTAEGTLEETTAILQRMRDLSVQSGNATNTATDRTAMQSEITTLQAELTRISGTSEFNNTALLDGTFTDKAFQIGHTATDTISLSLTAMGAADLNKVLTTAAVTAVTGVAAVTAVSEVAEVTAVAGTADLTFSASAAIGDITAVTVGSGTLSHEFTAAASASAAATAYKDAWNASSDAEVSKFTATTDGAKVTFSQNTAADGVVSASAVNSSASAAVRSTIAAGDTGIVGVAAVQGTAAVTVATQAQAAGDTLKVTIGDASFTYTAVDGDTADVTTTAASFVTKWNLDTDADVSKFTASSSLGVITLTQKVGGLPAAGTVTAVSVESGGGIVANDTAPIDGVLLVTEVKSTATQTFTVAAGANEIVEVNVGDASFTHDFGSSAPADVTATAAAMVTAWNNSTDTNVALYLASSSAGVVTYTEKVATASTLTTSTINGATSGVASATADGIAGVGAVAAVAAVTAVTGVDAVAAADAVYSSVNTLDISVEGGGRTAITSIDVAIAAVGAERASLGAFQNRLEHTVSNLSSMIENTSAARSRIQDADFAVESANLAKNQVMQQAGTAMLAQANASSQGVLSLLK